jgi:hypothetical protein
MKCEVCNTKFGDLEIVYRIRTLKRSFDGQGEKVVLMDVCKVCIKFALQVDEQGVQLKMNDKRRLKV